MDAISMWQPWAGLVALSLKPIETRRHRHFARFAGKRIAIHAAKTYDDSALRLDYLDSAIENQVPPSHIYLKEKEVEAICKLQGVILCTAHVDEHRKLNASDSPLALCDCSGGDLWGLILSDVRMLKKPIPWKGRQFPFHVPDEILEGAMACPNI